MSESTAPVLSNKDDGDDSNDSTIFWKVGEPIPAEFPSHFEPVRSTLIPRPIAWITVDNHGDVALIDGYTASCYTPPTIHMAASALPMNMLRTLKETRKCSISVATVSDGEVKSNYNNKFQTALCHDDNNKPKSFQCHELGLQCTSLKEDYPPTLLNTPIRMHCTLEHYVEFDDNIDKDEEAMIVLIVENFVINGSVLSPPTESMIRRNITAKIDAELIQPVVHLGNGIISKMSSIRSMPRPLRSSNDTDSNGETTTDTTTKWTSTGLNPVVSAMSPSSVIPNEDDDNRQQLYKTIEWNWRIDGASCPLGFNATTALIMPRPIGWISTYTKIGHQPHLAPYSFFIDVARRRPKVAFSAFRTHGGTVLKDAQKNAEETGYFCYNTVSEELAVSMNYSAAELGRDESEFELSNLIPIPAKLVDAPAVQDSKIVYECKYLQTINVAMFSIVVGEVVAVSIDRSILSSSGATDAGDAASMFVDPMKLRPIARLGYMDEYGLFY